MELFLSKNVEPVVTKSIKTVLSQNFKGKKNKRRKGKENHCFLKVIFMESVYIDKLKM